MATFTKRDGRWRAQVRRQGVSRSKTFTTKAQARAWATQVEHEISTGALAKRSTATLGDAFVRYARDVTPGHKGQRWERVRLKKLGKDPLADVRFCDLTAEHLAEFRDRRLREVNPGSVLREMGLLSGVLGVARREWNWIDHNPMADVARPARPRHRDRRISDDEVQRICWALGYTGGPPESQSQQVAVMFLLALRTGMRLGEICALRRRDLDLPGRSLLVRDSKNRDNRYVPLSAKAREILGRLEGEDRLFTVSSGVATTLFRRARIRCEIRDLTFHDTRHEFCSRAARKISVLDLAKVLGHRDPRSLMVYFNPEPREIAALLDAADGPTAGPRRETNADDDRTAPAQENRPGR